MNNPKSNNLLIISNIKSRFEGDIRNVFVIDYIKSVYNKINTEVLSTSLIGDGEIIDDLLFENQKYTHLSIVRSINNFTKPFYYIIWLYKSFQLGKKFKDISIIHCHATVLHGTLALMLSKYFNAKLILTEHTGPFSIITNSLLKKYWAKFLMQKAHCVLCVSDHLKNEIAVAGIWPKRILTTYNPVDTELFSPNFESQKKSKTFLFVGRLDEQKGAVKVLKAFIEVNKNYPEWKLIIIGDGREMNSIINLVNFNKLKNSVLVTGSQSKKEIADYMKKSTIFVFPSAHESFGLVVAEAMSAGLPIIIGNNSGPNEYVNVEHGIKIDTNNSNELVAAMNKMVETHENYDWISTRNYIIQKFGFENFGIKLMKIYNTQ